MAYAQALRMAYCQSNVAGVLLFHRPTRPLWRLAVGPLLSGWTPKSSLGIVRETLDAIANGTIRKCPLDPKPVVSVHAGQP